MGFEHDVWVSQSRGHGREEERVCLVLYNLEGLSTRADWVDLQAIVRVSRTNWEGDKETFEVAHYICSRRGSAEELGSATRGHWGIENGLHWVLDVIFREDDSRLKDRTAAENLGHAAARGGVPAPPGPQQGQCQRQVAPRRLGR